MPSLATKKRTSWLRDPWPLFAFTATFSLSVPGSASLKALLLFSLWGWLLIQEKRLKVLSVLWFISVGAAIAAASEIGFHMGVDQLWVTNQGMRTLTMFVILSVGLLLVNRREITTRRIDTLIFWIALLATVFKLAIIGVLVSGLATSEQVQSSLGFETVQDSIGFGLLRLQFPADIILQFMLVCYVGGRRRILDAAVLFCITVSVLLSFSRYIFAAYVVSLVLRGFLLRRVDFVSRVAGIIAAATIVTFFSALVTRFVGAGTSTSDSIRTQQTYAILAMIDQFPLLGTGMGSSAHGYVRSVTLPFSYEVQWYALTMQFGMIGVAWFLLNMLTPLVLIYRGNRNRIFFLIVWAVWAMSGFTNPYIVSVGSGFGLALLTLRLTRTNVEPSPRISNPRRVRPLLLATGA